VSRRGGRIRKTGGKLSRPILPRAVKRWEFGKAFLRQCRDKLRSFSRSRRGTSSGFDQHSFHRKTATVLSGTHDVHSSRARQQAAAITTRKQACTLQRTSTGPAFSLRCGIGALRRYANVQIPAQSVKPLHKAPHEIPRIRSIKPGQPKQGRPGYRRQWEPVCHSTGRCRA
jgi:hypothetical protein